MRPGSSTPYIKAISSSSSLLHKNFTRGPSMYGRRCRKARTNLPMNPFFTQIVLGRDVEVHDNPSGLRWHFSRPFLISRRHDKMILTITSSSHLITKTKSSFSTHSPTPENISLYKLKNGPLKSPFLTAVYHLY
jgi:hypothetical protein